MLTSGCNFDERGMTVWEFEHFKHRLRIKSNSSDAEHANNVTGLESGRHASRHRPPRLGVDGVKLGHLVGNQVRRYYMPCMVLD